MRRERTDLVSPRSFKRIAQLVVVGVALAGLTSCGGGGGSTSPEITTPTTPAPEIPITPDPAEPPLPTPAQLEAATVVTAGETTAGTLESPDDVKYYRLEVAERTRIEFTLEAGPGFELAILDNDGNVIVAAVTESTARLVVEPPSGSVIVRVRDKLKQGWEDLSQPRDLGGFTITPTNLLPAPVENLINVILGIPKLRVAAGGFSASLELRDHVRVRDGAKVIWTASVSYRGVGVQVDGTKVKLEGSDETRPGAFTVSLVASDPEGVVSYTPWKVEVGGGPVVKPEFAGWLRATRATIAEGETYTSQPVADFFELPAGKEWEYWAVSHQRPNDDGYDFGIRDGRLVVSTTGERRYNDNILIRVWVAERGRVRGSDSRSAWTGFSIIIGATLRVKPEYEGGVSARVLAGESYTSRDSSEYFDNPLDEDLTFTVEHTGGTLSYPDPGGFGKRWWWNDGQGTLSINSGTAMPDGRHIRLRLTAKNSAGSASLEFTITTVKPSGLPLVACTHRSPVLVTSCEAWWVNAEHGAARCSGTDSGFSRVSQCPTTGGQFRSIGSCRLGSVIDYWYIPTGESGSLPKYLCDRWGGSWTRHK